MIKKEYLKLLTKLELEIGCQKKYKDLVLHLKELVEGKRMLY